VTQHGLVAAERFLSLRVEIPDRPGSLARMLTLVGGEGGNVIDVVHSRVGSGLRLGDVEVSLRLECMGHEHGEQIKAALVAAGLTVHVDA
jgi:threonine dehydratase